MQIKVRSSEDQVLIELTGVAGRQMAVLHALSRCRAQEADSALADADVSIRSGSDAMRIVLQGRAGRHLEAEGLYRCLCAALHGDASPAAV